MLGFWRFGCSKVCNCHKISFQILLRLGSGESVVRQCATVANFIYKFEPRLGSGDSDVRNCATIANFMLKRTPRLGSGDSGVRKCATVANSVGNLAPRLGSGDSSVRKCATVANFIGRFAPRLGSGDLSLGAGRAGPGRGGPGRAILFFDHTFNNALATRATTTPHQMLPTFKRGAKLSMKFAKVAHFRTHESLL